MAEVFAPVSIFASIRRSHSAGKSTHSRQPISRVFAVFLRVFTVLDFFILSFIRRRHVARASPPPPAGEVSPKATDGGHRNFSYRQIRRAPSVAQSATAPRQAG